MQNNTVDSLFTGRILTVDCNSLFFSLPKKSHFIIARLLSVESVPTMIRWNKVISLRVIYRQLYNLRSTTVTVILPDNVNIPTGIILDADITRDIHGKLLLVFPHYCFTLEY